MQRASLSTSIYLALVFLSGTLVGGFAHRLYTLNTVSATTGPRSPDESRRRYIEELRTRLHLSNDQVEKLRPILKETGRRYRELMERHRPEMKEIQKEMEQQIRAVLNDNQQDEFARIQQEHEKRHSQGR